MQQQINTMQPNVNFGTRGTGTNVQTHKKPYCMYSYYKYRSSCGKYVRDNHTNKTCNTPGPNPKPQLQRTTAEYDLGQHYHNAQDDHARTVRQNTKQVPVTKPSVGILAMGRIRLQGYTEVTQGKI